MIQRILIVVQCLLWMVLLSRCTSAYKNHVSDYHFASSDPKPDYSNLDYWAAHPYKHDPSDSIPLPLQPDTHKDSMVDVFFLHPTTFGSSGSWNADINDPELNAKTDYTTILFQASAFNECRVFAPRYRQANIRAYYSTDTVSSSNAFDLAYQDIKSAFQYYLEHFNGGRPIIIASHSQGSTHAERLLNEFFENSPLQSKLVAAYIVGMVIPKEYFSALKPCRDSLQTGCFVGWRTFKKGYEADYAKKEHGNSWVTNPIIWTTSDQYAPKELNSGGILTNFKKLVPNVSDAWIHENVLWIHKPHFPGSFFYRSKNYHVGDINLFYMNIRQNIRTRIRAFRK
ncbi:MAG: DUF3089 domain-containing protein [Chitinophagales bacterium]